MNYIDDMIDIYDIKCTSGKHSASIDYGFINPNEALQGQSELQIRENMEEKKVRKIFLYAFKN